MKTRKRKSDIRGRLTTRAGISLLSLWGTGSLTAAVPEATRALIEAQSRTFTGDATIIVSGNPGETGGRVANPNFWQAALDQGDVEGTKQAGSTAAADRVGFPRNYRSTLKLLGVSTKEQEPSVMSAYGNEQAASVVSSAQLPFPNGTVIAMEFAHGTRDGEGQFLHDPDGTPVRGEVARVDVMRRGPGFGEAYGDSRAGEWEFASYRPDGSTLIAPKDAAACAACHRKAGAERDFVYRIRVPAK